MVQPYLRQPNYLNAMSVGLGNKLNYLKYQQSKRPKLVIVGSSDSGHSSGSGGSHGGPHYHGGGSHDSGAPAGSPDDRAFYRAGRTDEDKNNIAKLKEEEALKQQKLQTTKKALDNVLSYVPALTQDNYKDWYDYGQESTVIPTKLFVSPEIVDTYTPEKFKIYKNELKAPPVSMLNFALKEKELQDRKEQMKQKKKEKNSFIKVNPQVSRKDSVADDKILVSADEKFNKGDGSLIFDKQGGSSVAKLFNNAAKRKGSTERYIWKENGVPVQNEGLIADAKNLVGIDPGTEQIPGWVKVDLNDEINTPPQKLDQITLENPTEEQVKQMEPGTKFIMNGKTYVRR